MLNLKNRLQRHNIETEIIHTWPDHSVNLDDHSAFILDKRDAPFPEEIIQRDVKRIAMDNRGMGRCQAHLDIDTLPHYNMSIHEFKQALSHIMIPEFLGKKPSKILHCRLKYFPGKKPVKKDFRSNYKESNISINKKTGQQHLDMQLEYLSRLERSEPLYTYFGQTLFEAIYLGRRISLYDVSPYHRRLSRWFFRRWNALPSPAFYFDGKGLWRVSQKIYEFLQ